MKETNCNHCGKAFDEAMRYCPYCNTPTPKQKELETQKKFIRYFLILIVFCIIMVLWLPRDM